MTLRPLSLFLALGLIGCGPVDISDGTDCDPCGDDDGTEPDDDDGTEPDDDDGTEPDDDDGTEPDDDDPWAGYVEASGFIVSFSQTGFSGDLYQADAYMVGYGADGNFGYNLNNWADNKDGRFAFDTSGWEEGDYLASVISSLSVTNNGGGEYSYEEIDSWDETGDWWNTLPFCYEQEVSQTAADWCAHEGGSNYFVAFEVTSSGVVPNGD